MADTIRPNMDLDAEVAHYLEQCEALKGVACNAETAPKFRTLQAEEVRLRRKLDDARKAEKEPHLEAGRAVDAKFNPKIASLADAVRLIANGLTKFLQAEEERRRAEAAETKRKAEEAERSARELAAQAEAEDDPFASFEQAEQARTVAAEASSLQRAAAAPIKVNVAGDDGARAGGLKSFGWLVEVEDPSAFVAYFAERVEVLELCLTLAKREAKATRGKAIPGCKLTEDRRAG